jgi:hypothetical protein
MNETPGRSLAPYTMCRHSQKGTTYESVSRLSPDMKSADALISAFLASQNVRNKFILFINRQR